MSDNTFWAQDAILIVDDDILQRELFKNCLEDLGLDLLEAEDGVEALQVFREKQPMLVVMDVNMPRKNGLEACREMKRIAGEDGVAVILVTGQGDTAMVQEAYQAGASEYMTKPVDWEMLVMRVKFALRIQQDYLVARRKVSGLTWAQAASGLGSWAIDTRNQTLVVSDEVRNILDLDEERDTFGLNELPRIVPVDGNPGAHDGLLDYMKTGGLINLDYNITTVKGRRVVIHLYGEPARPGDGHPEGYYGFIQDITERKRAEHKIREASALKDQFLTNVSHELRTPLNGVLGMADLLGQTDLDTDQSDLVDLLRHSARKLLGIVGDLLDYSAVTTHKLTLNNLEISLQQIEEKIREAAEPLTRKKGLEFRLQMAGDLPSRVVGDARRITQVALALVDNAVKFTEQGSVAVEISRFDSSADKDWVRFAVSDTGTGIPEDKQKDIFNTFAQADGSMTRAAGGVGLGLPLSRELVSMMGGRIGLQNRPGGGTEFWFVLPFERLDEPVPEPGTHPLADETSNRILVVEDDPINQLYIRKCLLKLGHEVELANDGSEALERVRENSFRLILMDCQMPVMDGYEASRRIRETDGPNASIPIIALTAHAGPEDRQKCLDAGMDVHMTKPFTTQELMLILNAWLGPMPLGSAR